MSGKPIMQVEKRVDYITQWISDYAGAHGIQSLIVGISGGIDSSVVSTLCARTGLRVYALSMPINQLPQQHDSSIAHAKWLEKKHADNVTVEVIDLSLVYNQFSSIWPENHALALANSKSRLRMTTLYHYAQQVGGLVVGTGNRVEDFGVGFFTKYGDGGVDISPIGDCTKTQVWDMGKALGILPEIIAAAPTDGLWDDGRTDQDQLGGMTYQQLEEAMHLDEQGIVPADHQAQICLDLYRSIRRRSLHKMRPIPVCHIDD